MYRRRPGGKAATARPEGLRPSRAKTLSRPPARVNRHFSYKSSTPSLGLITERRTLRCSSSFLNGTSSDISRNSRGTGGELTTACTRPATPRLSSNSILWAGACCAALGDYQLFGRGRFCYETTSHALDSIIRHHHGSILAPGFITSEAPSRPRKYTHVHGAALQVGLEAHPLARRSPSLLTHNFQSPLKVSDGTVPNAGGLPTARGVQYGNVLGHRASAERGRVNCTAMSQTPSVRTSTRSTLPRTRS